MAFELGPFQPEEEMLFAQLPLEDRFMGYGAVGHMRAELEWYDFNHMWCPEDKRLAGPAFHRERKELLRTLRGENGVFYSCQALSDFLEHAQSLANGDKGFNILTPGYSYCVRCRTTERYGYDITMYAYDNALLLPELAGLHELPEKCFSVMPESGELVMLQQERPYIFPFHSDDPPEIRRQVADELNEAMGVTKAQEAAMRMGVEHGFGQPCAWPWQYDQNGEPRCSDKPHKKEKEAR